MKRRETAFHLATSKVTMLHKYPNTKPAPTSSNNQGHQTKATRPTALLFNLLHSAASQQRPGSGHNLLTLVAKAKSVSLKMSYGSLYRCGRRLLVRRLVVGEGRKGRWWFVRRAGTRGVLCIWLVLTVGRAVSMIWVGWGWKSLASKVAR